MKEKEVRMFVCGQTVYDDAHLGHAKTYVQLDNVVRWLRRLGYKVFYIQNITDIEDKIIQRAKEKKQDIFDLARFYEKRFMKDMQSLKVAENIDMFPKTSDYIPQMIEQIKMLIKKGFAYVVKGDVYYDVSKFKDYTKIDPVLQKRNHFDFSLWKSQKPDELAWDSPWGRGRPGWHIEDTAMATSIFNAPQYDLHGGATELIFPHHTNEIAQNEAATGKKPFVKYWLHTGVLQIRGIEMHKSLGNFITIKETLKKNDPEVIRFYFASTHYRKPIDFKEADLEQAKTRLKTLYTTLRNVKYASTEDAKSNEFKKILVETKNKFAEAMNNDFNTPLALAHLFALSKKTNQLISKNKINPKLGDQIISLFVELGSVLGILENKIESDSASKEVEELIMMREEARIKKNWKKADEIRKKIKELGYSLEDTSDGVRWEKIR
jgi:cysteinyl-tRNA synthetase